MKKNEKLKNYVLEQSTNTHRLEAEYLVAVKEISNGIVKLKIKGKGIVTHGEHGTVVTESENVVKYVQQELNPITEAFQNAYD
jgi:hypothetical protein